MPVDAIYFHHKFFHGTLNDEKFRDLATFTPGVQADQEHLDRIFDFIDDVLEGQLLLGKNVYNKGLGYEVTRTAHYHSGPYANISLATWGHVSQNNSDGARSGPAIHYCWKGQENALILLGYSPIKHDKPFPQMHHKDNPLRQRVKPFYQSADLIPLEKAFPDIYGPVPEDDE